MMTVVELQRVITNKWKSSALLQIIVAEEEKVKIIKIRIQSERLIRSRFLATRLRVVSIFCDAQALETLVVVALKHAMTNELKNSITWSPW